MNELGQALKIIFEKLAAFFDIFDLSFFVSGAVALGAIVFWIAEFKIPVLQVERWLLVSILILGSYASGLICFAAARFIRQTLIRQPTDDQLSTILAAHGLSESKAVQNYLQRPHRLRGQWRLYIRFWSDLRGVPDMAGPLNFLNRYWVMAATYDGVAFALIVWFIVLADCLLRHKIQPILETAALLIIIALLSVACFHEASRYMHHQIENLVATIAAIKAKADVE
jgi:hypothetical protein